MMDEPRESRLATILARGLERVRKRAERSCGQTVKSDEPPSLAAESAGGNETTAHHAARQQGDQQ
jgi:hypothetical protein